MVFSAPGTVQMQDVPEPDAGPGEVVVAVAAAGICGSELHGIRTPGFRTPPLIMGHEFVGTAPDGRRVAVNPVVSCDACDMCGRGRVQLCRSRSLIGIGRPGGFAERVAVPGHVLHELPAGLDWHRAALVEPLANAVHAWRLASPDDPRAVGIIGAGTIGLVCLLVAKATGGARVRVDVADTASGRLRLAERLGADAGTGRLDGEYDVVIDAVGTPGTRADSVERLRPGGTAVWLGLASGEPGIDPLGLIRSEKRILGSFAYGDDEFAEAIALATELQLDWATPFPLDHGAAIFTELMNGRSDVVKALLVPGAEPAG